jgi:hypothetical protein
MPIQVFGAADRSKKCLNFTLAVSLGPRFMIRAETLSEAEVPGILR